MFTDESKTPLGALLHLESLWRLRETEVISFFFFMKKVLQMIMNIPILFLFSCRVRTQIQYLHR